MINGEKFKQVFPNIQIDMGEIYIYVWIDHEPAHITKEWWNAEYKEPTTPNDCETCIHNKGILECDMYGCKYEPTIKNDVPKNNVGKIDPTTKNGLALIHIEGLDEEIRCTMCTNYMKSDRGCDGSCVVNNDMYKAVMDAIEERIQPTTTNDVPENNVGKIDPTVKNDLAVDCIVDVLGSYTDLDIPYKREIAENILTKLPSVIPQEPRCKDCKWWKDSDGVYRRGCGAESQCPINRREVFEGNGYCYLFEPQESEDT